MILKNNLKTQKAQSSVEYLMLFAIIATLTLLGITNVFPRLQSAGVELFNKAMQAMH